MTSEDYKQLYQKYKTTDSVSEKDQLKEKIIVAAIALVKWMGETYTNMGYADEFIDDDDYRTDRGGWSVDYFDEDEIQFTYSDSWRYGGYCELGKTINPKYFDVENRNALVKKLKEKQIKDIETKIKNLTADIAYKQNLITELEKTLKEKRESFEEEYNTKSTTVLRH